MLIRSLLKKSRIRLARDVFATYATHASLANDVIDTDGWAQDDSTHGRAQARLMLLLEFASKTIFFTNRKTCRWNSILVILRFCIIVLFEQGVYRFKGNVEETSERRGWGAYGLFRAQRYHLELN